MSEFASLRTESTNQQTKNIDKLDALGIAKAINDQDKTVADAVEKALPEIDGRSQREYIAPRNETEQIICDLFAEVLRADKVGVKDNFFESM